MIFVAPGVVVWVSVWRVRVLGVDVGCCGQDSVSRVTFWECEEGAETTGDDRS
jgi:hypothetical protein